MCVRERAIERCCLTRSTDARWVAGEHGLWGEYTMFTSCPPIFNAFSRSTAITVLLLWLGIVAEIGKRWTLVDVWVLAE
jgi:hypothetical protein